MAKVRDDNFFVTYGWMPNQLGLKGVALQIFSIIYGFDRDGSDGFRGSLQYLVRWTNCSKNTVIKALKELVEKGYIKKTENIVNNVRFCIYQINAPYVQKMRQGSAETELEECSKITPSPGTETEHNNNTYNNSLTNKEIVQNVVDLYNTICISFPRVRGITADRERETLSILKNYSLADVKEVFSNAENSSYLKGNNQKGWLPTFDWIMKSDNFLKILEGNYTNKGENKAPGQPEQTVGKAEREAIRRMLEDV